jgi:hypothetical protein
MAWIDRFSLRKAKRAGNLVLLVITFALTLLGIEFLLRLYLPLHFVSSNEFYRYDPEMGFVVKPGHHLTLKDYQQEVYVSGLGTINFQEDFREYEKLIFALGDSYTQGIGVHADASYPFQLDLLLNLDEGGIYRKKFGVVNLGLSAFGGEQSLIAFKRYTRLIGKPALVLYLGCDNDYSDDIWFKSGGAHKGIVEGNPYWGWMYIPVKWAFVDTEIGKRVKYLIKKKRLEAQRDTIRIGTPAPGTPKGEGKTSVAELEINVLQRIIQTCKGNGAQVILSWANDSPSYQYLRSWAKQEGYAFADWIPAVHSVRKSIPALPPGNPHSGGHYRTWVNQLIAREFAREIKKLMADNP